MKNGRKLKLKDLVSVGRLMGAMIHERLYKNRHGKLYAGNREVVQVRRIHLRHWICLHSAFSSHLLKRQKKSTVCPN